MDTKGYTSLYLEETREHLSALISILKEKPTDPERINEAFRHIHSIKGMAASMSFEKSEAIAHKMESILGRWRSGDEIRSGETLWCVKTCDYLSSLCDAIESKGNEEIEVVKELESHIEEASLFDSSQSHTKAITSFEKKGESIKKDSNNIKSTHKLHIEIDPKAPIPSARAIIIFSLLKQKCIITNMEPSIETIQKGDFSGVADFFISTDNPKELTIFAKNLPEIISATISEIKEETEEKGRLVKSIRVASDLMDILLADTSDTILLLSKLEEEAKSAPIKLRQIIEELHPPLEHLFSQILYARLVPFDTLIERLEKTIRELCTRCNKKVKLKVEGQDERVDRSMLEALMDPFQHMIRNCLDHGIGTPEERLKIGKPEEGTISIEIQRIGDSMSISISDDGRGIDVSAVREKAITLGILPPEKINVMTDTELLYLITIPSFSTREIVSEISGRGVGMDVVRDRIESMGGHLSIETEKSKGTTFKLIIPSALTLSNLLTFRCKGDIFALPVSHVHAIVRIDENSIKKIGGRVYINMNDKTIPRLAFGSESGENAIIINSEKKGAIIIDELFGVEKSIIRPIGSILGVISEWNGAITMKGEKIAIVLDGKSIVNRYGGGEIHV